MCNVKERIRQTDTADDADRDGDGAPPAGEGRGQRFESRLLPLCTGRTTGAGPRNGGADFG